MGTYSTQPFGSDAAEEFKAALVDQMMKPLRLVVGRKTLRSARYHYDEARAAVQFVLSHNPEILGGPPLVPALQALVRIRGDQEWLDNWDDSKKIARTLDSEIDAVIKRMESMPAYILFPRYRDDGGRPRRPAARLRGNATALFGDRETHADARARARAELDECKALVRALRTPSARVA
jgi:hypothetical protein